MVDSAEGRAIDEFMRSPENTCFACGPGNPHGLGLQPRREGDLVVADFVPGPWHEGWQGVVHGGILTTVLDETMAYTLFLEGLEGVTGRLELRYRAPVAQGDHLRVEARIARRRGRAVDIEGRVLRTGEIVVEGTARFMVVGTLDLAALRSPEGVG